MSRSFIPGDGLAQHATEFNGFPLAESTPQPLDREFVGPSPEEEFTLGSRPSTSPGNPSVSPLNDLPEGIAGDVMDGNLEESLSDPPIRAGSERRRAQPASQPALPIRVMIADTQALFRDGLRVLIQAEPDLQFIGEVSDAVRLLEMVLALDPDVVLIELEMAGGSGLQVLQDLQTARSRSRIIVMTTTENREDHVRAVRLGTSGTLQKTTSRELLLKSIHKVHEGEIWLDRLTTAEVMRQYTLSREPASSRTDTRERPPAALSRREKEIVGLVTQGYRNRELAGKLFISEQTVKNHLHNIFDKLGVSDRLELALYAIHHKLLEN